MKRLLVIVASETANKTVVEKLSALRYPTSGALSLEDGRNALKMEQFDLAIVDWKLVEPVIEEFAAALKKTPKQTLLVALADDMNKEPLICALNKGADDYCESPFINGRFNKSIFELLLARVEARLRFGGTNIIDVGELVIDPDEEKIYYKQREVELKGKPFEVLTHLARSRDTIISKEQLLDAIWEEPELVTPNVIEVAINQIRQKIDKPLGINTIETVRRRGYRFCFPNCSGQTITDK
ncbi:MAG: homeostatic response regulator transcription factor HsrA [Helicobacteraceae bacterium]|nr:homeostatic response regulator transcription factor HsrA [Helicobacteraceae bacterium]